MYVTAPNAEVADTLASALVEQQLVACVNIVPGLTSVYTWKVSGAANQSLSATVGYLWRGGTGLHSQQPCHA